MSEAINSIKVEDHVCAICFARVISAATADPDVREYRCTTCGSRATGKSAAVICACGAKSSRGKLLGFRCVKNPDKSPENPFEIVARQT